MVRTAQMMIDDKEYTLAYTPGCLQCIEDLGYSGIDDMLSDERYQIRNIIYIIEAMIKCGAYQDKKRGKEPRTISVEELRMTLSAEELNESAEILGKLQNAKPDVEADVPKN